MTWYPRTDDDYERVRQRAKEIAFRPVDREWLLFCAFVAQGRSSLTNDVPSAWDAAQSSLRLLAEDELRDEARDAEAAK